MDDVDERLIALAAERGFDQQGDAATADFIAALARLAQPGRVLELGTGMGFSTRRIAAAVPDAVFDSVELDSALSQVAQDAADCAGVYFHICDGEEFLRARLAEGVRYDFIFADTWPGKYHALEDALSLLRPGGLYVIDDMLSQPSWPEGHGAKAQALLSELARDQRLRFQHFLIGTGIGLAQRVAD